MLLRAATLPRGFLALGGEPVTHTFLQALFGGMTGTLELRPVPAVPSLRDFLGIEGGNYEEARVASYVARSAAQRINAFFGVATRRVGATSGRAENCCELPALFIDADFKLSQESRVLEALVEFPLEPSIVVSTGGGMHAYWLLHEPLDLSDAGKLADSTNLMRRLAAAFSAIADESVSEPARVLRLPGTRNFKYPHTPLVTLDVCDADRRYTVADICEHIPATAPPRPWRGSSSGSLRPGDAQTGAFRLQDTIEAGDRHSTMFALLRSQAARGLSFEAAYASCAIENENRSEVPIEEQELLTYLRRAWDTPNRSNA